MSYSVLMGNLRYLDLTDVEAAALRETFSTTVVFERKSDIVVRDERGMRSSLILDGYACRYKLTDDGQRQIVALHIPGDMFGIESLILNFLDYSVEAETACTVATASHESVRNLMEEYPPHSARAVARKPGSSIDQSRVATKRL
ncbi:MAG: Crp/Fnr family transcriptional regulator [Sphingomonadales bacterium]